MLSSAFRNGVAARARHRPIFRHLEGAGALTTLRASTAPRIHAIDYLRGLFALSILVYHYTGETGIRTDTLERIGIYGVCAFYVISGISFGYVYRNLRFTPRDILSFGIKRFFRLAPLYWLALAATLAVAWPVTPRLIVLVANVTLTFGVVAPAAYLVGGGWSIGNEVAFYCLFPFAIVALRRKPAWFVVLLMAAAGFAAWYAFFRLSPSVELAKQWARYVRPENHVILFLAGLGVSRAIGEWSMGPRTSWGLMTMMIVLFLVMPVGADQIALVTGWTRFSYIGWCVAVCGVGALGTLPVPRLLDSTFAWLGQVSYAVYLLHLVVYTGLARILGVRGTVPLALLAAAISLVGAHFVYRTIEAPMIRLGKRVADRTSMRAVGSPRAGEAESLSLPIAP